MSVTFDNSEFLWCMRSLVKETGVELNTVMRWQMGLWVQDIIKKIYTNPSWTYSVQKKHGEAAIYGELRGTSSRGNAPLFAAYDPVDSKPVDLDRINAVKLKAKTGGFYLVDQERFLPNATLASMERIHHDNRVKGHVRVKGYATRKAGKMDVQMAYTVPQKLLNDYVKKVQARVGTAKAGWLKAFYHFQKTVGMNLLPTKPQSWISRHEKEGWRVGVVGDSFDAKVMKGDWYAGTNGDYGIDPQTALNRTFPTRMKDLQGGKALLRLKGRIEKYNAKGARAT